jgi:rare lipoprotein A (peptidoglycan hydrolase)
MRMTLRTYSLVLVLLAALAYATAPVALAATGGAAAPAGSPAGTPAPPSGLDPSAIATWFGPGFYGKHTACGQKLTPRVVGVANRTLPCGTLVQVTYSGHTLTVPVLDRGPYSHHASWDLTAGAAQALGITETVRIETHVVGKTANTPALGLPAGSQETSTQEQPSATGGLSASGGSLAG